MFHRLTGKKLNWAITAASALCFSCFGYDQGVFGGLLGSTAFLSAMNHPDSDAISTMASVYPLGCLIGCIIVFVFGQRLGRRIAIIAGCLLVTIGGALQAGAVNQGMIIATRIVAGMGTGMTSTSVPMWIAETSPAKTRGRDIAIQLCIVLSGNVTAYWFDYGMLTNHVGQIVWRLPIAFQCFYVLVGAGLIYFLPESPRMLYQWGRTEEADSVLSRLLESSPSDAKFDSAKNEILEAIELETRAETNVPLWRSLLWDPTTVNNSKRFYICITMQMLQQMGGCNAITYYQTTLMSDAVGLDAHMSSLMGGFSALAFFVGTLPPIFLIDRVGRRFLFLAGSALSTAFMVAFMVCVKFAPGNPAVGWAGIAMIFAYEFAFACSWNVLVWVYAPEISPLRFRHVNTAAAVGTEWLFTFVTVRITPIGIQNLGYKFFAIFSVFSLLQFIFAWQFCPETKGLTLEAIDAMFSRKNQEVSHLTHDGQDAAVEEKNISLEDVKV